MRVVSSKQRREIEVFFGDVKEKARKLFERDGACVPVAIFLYDGEQVILPLGRLGNKDLAATLLKALIARTKPLAFVMVTEAWMAAIGRDPTAAGTPPDDLEKKYGGTLVESTPDGKEKPKEGVREAVMLQCSSVTGESFMLTAKIVRNPNRKPSLKPWERMENGDAQGRFVFDVTPLETRQ